ncbi:two-component system histidine kinase PnpS [Paenibacillus sp. UMB4589-SE434]|uniref:two-component system histidine kinase PnpS n=1 Tax=Paenibacillus sp. UMB4589-SE434 TaxID=3046314 RepID=UPI00254F8825|nr:ATP-binding protein [Paenibacillus sp. UMB4589-SE434]MDK8182351.1 ATP-binding protein [Paenibacillus sp. UMB4589-SE434]
MARFRSRLTLIFVLLIGVSVLAAGIYMASSFKSNHISQLEQNMSREIMLIEQTLQWQAEPTSASAMAFYTDWSKKLEQTTGARVTFVTLDGTVVGDSISAVSQMDNHLNREEIKNARDEGLGSVIRYSDTIKQNMLYVAAPIHDDNFEGYVRLAMSLQEVEQSVRELWAYLGIGLLVLFLVATLVSYRIAFNLTRPIENMTRVAHQIAHMDYKARAQTTSTDEIGQLGNAINAMADSLQLQMAQIRENEGRLRTVMEHMINAIVMIDDQGEIVLINRKAEQMLGIKNKASLGKKFEEVRVPYELAEMTQEVIERKLLVHEELTIYYPEERLLDANVVPVYYSEQEWAGVLIMLQDVSDIRRLERMRSEFVANVSHELKTPIAAVKGFAETLMNGALNDPEIAQSFLQIIHDESERLNRLIGDILELSKIESKRVPLQFSPVHMPSFMQQAVEMLSKEADKKRIQVSLVVEDDMYMEADEDRLRQIVLNLLSNAINYTSDGGQAKVVAAPLDVNEDGDYERIQLTISDTGIGIPKKDLPRIFERFYRVDKARSRGSGGTGLGLSIVKHLVDSHHGTIKVDSEIGVGTTFTIELPVLQDHHPDIR